VAQEIPDLTLRTLARTFFAHGRDYGFHFEDYVQFVNVLLELAMEAENTGVHVPLDQGPMPLKGERIVVRALRDDDRAIFSEWMTDASGRYLLLSRSTGQSIGVDELLSDPANSIGIITTTESDRAIGALLFLSQDHQSHKAELRKIVGEPAFRGQGIGTEATRLWVGFGLHQLGLKKIYLYTLASNHHNISLNESLGFRVEGILRKEVFFDDSHHDLLRMGLVAPS